MKSRWIALGTVIAVTVVLGMGACGSEGASRQPGPPAAPAQSISDPPGPQGTPTADPGLAIHPDSHTAYAYLIGADVAAMFARNLGSPLLPESGEVRGDTASAIWKWRTEGAFWFEFPSGLVITYIPDPRTPDEYVQDVAKVVASGRWPGTQIPVRGTLAQAHDPAVTGQEPASLSWIEGRAIVEMVGGAGQTLADLSAVAEAMMATPE